MARQSNTVAIEFRTTIYGPPDTVVYQAFDGVAHQIIQHSLEEIPPRTQRTLALFILPIDHRRRRRVKLDTRRGFDRRHWDSGVDLWCGWRWQQAELGRDDELARVPRTKEDIRTKVDDVGFGDVDERAVDQTPRRESRQAEHRDIKVARVDDAGGTRGVEVVDDRWRYRRFVRVEGVADDLEVWGECQHVGAAYDRLNAREREVVHIQEARGEADEVEDHRDESEERGEDRHDL